MKRAAFFFISILACCVCQAQVSLSNGLVLHLPLDGNASDVSGNAHTATNRNVSFAENCEGLPGKAAYFNGTNSMLEIPASLALNSTEKLTIALWVKTAGNTSISSLISRAKRVPNEQPSYGYGIDLDGKQTALFSMITPPLCYVYSNWVSDAKPVATDKWTSIIAVFDGVQQTLYVDGILVGESFLSFDKLSLCETDIPLFIGAAFPDQQTTFKGWMDDIRIYNRAITAGEIQVLSNTCSINPACIAPSAININGSSSSSIQVAWQQITPGTSTLVQFREAGNPSWINAFQTTQGDGSINGLQLNKTYDIRLATICAVGDSSGWKTASYTLLGDTRCDAPFNLQVTSTTDNTATLTWEVLPSGIGVNIQYAESGTGNWVDAAAEVTDRTYTIEGLNPGTPYDVRIQTACNLGPSVWTGINFTTTGISPCRAPGSLLPFDLSGNRAALKWAAGEESVQFEVEYKLPTSVNWLKAYTTPVPDEMIYVDSLQPLTTYQWRVRSVCATGNSEWSQGEFTTTPGTPVNVGIQLLADFNHTPANCLPAEIKFENASVTTRTSIATILWDFGDGEVSVVKDPVHHYKKEGNYTVSLTVTDPDGRTSAKTKQVIIVSTTLRFATTSGNITVCKADSLTIKAEGGIRYAWFPCEGLSDCNSASPAVMPGIRNRYTVRVTDANGCVDTASLTVNYVDPAKKFFIPNAFTPNGDGLNDVFRPMAGIQATGEVEWKVFNRFGSTLISSSRPDAGWDGNIKGSPAPAGNYSYFIRFKASGSCPAQHIKGTVTLIR